MARTKIPIDWNRVEKMAIAGANGVQIAAALGICYATLERRNKEDNNVDFVEFLTTKREKGNEALLSKQYDIAMSGDKTMLIWLGKQRLDQKERTDHTTNNKDLNIINLGTGEADNKTE